MAAAPKGPPSATRGRPGLPRSLARGGRFLLPRALSSRESTSRRSLALVGGRSSPVTIWLRALARHAHQECGGPGVGAIGMCFTGNFALTMMLEPSMLAPVLAQPSLPLKQPAGLEIAPDEIRAVRERLDRKNLTVLAYRFKGDKICRAERFAAYAAALGDRFIPRELPDSAANADVSHSLPSTYLTHTASSLSISSMLRVSRRSPPATKYWLFSRLGLRPNLES